MMDSIASTDSSSSSKEIDISENRYADLKRMKNMNWSTSVEDKWLI